MSKNKSHTKLIKKAARELGFSGCGISEAVYPKEAADFFEQWLAKGYHGEMKYMERNIDKRKDPHLLFKEAKSVVSVILNYYPATLQKDKQAPRIAKYAYGHDYHHVIKDKLFMLLDYIQREVTPVKGKVCVDTAPFMDIAWARRGGLGWVGRHSLLINPEYGSYILIGELILDIDLDYDKPMENGCGDCTRCIDACPTGAIVQPYILDARKCISYHSIEQRSEAPCKINFNNWVFGCDICQDVCPYNKNPKPHDIPEFNPKPEILNYTQTDWLQMDSTDFKRIFKGSAVERSGYEGFMRNIKRCPGGGQ